MVVGFQLVAPDNLVAVGRDDVVDALDGGNLELLVVQRVIAEVPEEGRAYSSSVETNVALLLVASAVRRTKARAASRTAAVCLTSRAVPSPPRRPEASTSATAGKCGCDSPPCDSTG